MIITRDRLTAHITHTGPTRTRHLVAALRFVETFLTAVAGSYHGLCHAILYKLSHIGLSLFFYLTTAQGDVAWFFAVSVRDVEQTEKSFLSPTCTLIKSRILLFSYIYYHY